MPINTADEQAAIQIQKVHYRYGSRHALVDLDLVLPLGKIVAFLGPNGSGKSTLFRLLSTLIPLQDGSISVLGQRLPQNVLSLRKMLGILFQSPSLDKKLTVRENLLFQASFYSLSQREASRRVANTIEEFHLGPYKDDYVEKLSGGWQRRVELAKVLLHRPKLLLLDEPSTGIDPQARIELWQILRRLNQATGLSVILTTHLLEEAEKADQIVLLNEGKVVANDTPKNLRQTLGNEILTIETQHPKQLQRNIEEKFSLPTTLLRQSIRIEHTKGHHLVSTLVETFGDEIDSIQLGKPTLEDLFIQKTGASFRAD